MDICPDFIPTFNSQCEGAGRGGGADEGVEGGKVTGTGREEEELMKTS